MLFLCSTWCQAEMLVQFWSMGHFYGRPKVMFIKKDNYKASQCIERSRRGSKITEWNEWMEEL